LTTSSFILYSYFCYLSFLYVSCHDLTGRSTSQNRRCTPAPLNEVANAMIGFPNDETSSFHIADALYITGIRQRTYSLN